jgi:hypothetical protein
VAAERAAAARTPARPSHDRVRRFIFVGHRQPERRRDRRLRPPGRVPRGPRPEGRRRVARSAGSRGHHHRAKRTKRESLGVGTGEHDGANRATGSATHADQTRTRTDSIHRRSGSTPVRTGTTRADGEPPTCGTSSRGWSLCVGSRPRRRDQRLPPCFFSSSRAGPMGPGSGRGPNWPAGLQAAGVGRPRRDSGVVDRVGV